MKDPSLVKYLLVAGQYSGSNISHHLIRHNFPECVDNNLWYKTHFNIEDDRYKEVANNPNLKIIFILSDPRDTATRLAYLENGWCYPVDCEEDYKYTVSYLDDVYYYITNLLRYYIKNFNDQLIVLKYEDAVYNTKNFLDRVGAFLNLKPLYIDDVKKYKHSIYKEVGSFRFYYPNAIIEEHYNRFIQFYERFNYQIHGHLDRYPGADLSKDYVDFNTHQYPAENYTVFLERNNVSINAELEERINGIIEI